MHCASIGPYNTGYLFTNVPDYPVNLHNYWCCVCVCVWNKQQIRPTTCIFTINHTLTVCDEISFMIFNILQKVL